MYSAAMSGIGLRWFVSGALLALAWTGAGTACSAGGTDTSNSGGRGGASGNGAGGSIDPMGGSSGLSTGGSGIDPAGGSSGVGGIGVDSSCTGLGQEAENKLQPADIIAIVDNSCSMTAEAGFVQTHMNNFAQAIIAANIDPHVVLISAGSDGA